MVPPAGETEVTVTDDVPTTGMLTDFVSEQPAGKIRHHPERLASAITALAQGKLGAWRARAEVGGI